MISVLTTDTIIDATIAAFNKRYANTKFRNIATREKLLDGSDLFNHVRPFSIYRDACISLCLQFTNNTAEEINALFPGEVKPDAAADRLRRNIMNGNYDYTQPYKTLIVEMVPASVRGSYYAATILTPSAPVRAEEPPAPPVTPPAPQPPAKGTFASRSDKKATQGFSDAMKSRMLPPPPSPPSPPKDIPAIRTFNTGVALTMANIKQIAVIASNAITKETLQAYAPQINPPCVTLELVDSLNRTAPVAAVRHISIYACHMLLRGKPGGTIYNIARNHGNRDHTTAIQSIRNINQKIVNGDEHVLKTLAKMTRMLDCTPEAAQALLKGDASKLRAKRPPASESPTGP